MNNLTQKFLPGIVGILLIWGLFGCNPMESGRIDQKETSNTAPVSQASPLATREATLTRAPKNNTSTPLPPPPSPSPTTTRTPLPAGPDEFPENVNPLSGLPVQDPDLLDLPPALVSISNAPLPTRPQAGLSFSPLVFEMYIGEGVSRYLAVFYGEFPHLIPGSPGDVDYGMEEAAVGPIRSGRLPYAKLRQIYNGFLVFASASSRVLPYLEEYYIFYREDLNDYNLALLPVEKLIGMAEEMLPNHSKRALFGNQFDSSAPTEGKDAKVLWVPFHELDQIVWEYNAKSGAYQRYQDREDGKTFELMTDRLTGEALAFENIIILLADYTFYDATLFNIELMYLDRYPALLFRDGKMQEITWSTANEDFEASTGFIRPIRFRYKDGQPVPLKHGQTWVEIIPRNSPYYEVPAILDYAQLTTNHEPGSAHWLVNFQQPPFPKNVEPEDLDE